MARVKSGSAAALARLPWPAAILGDVSIDDIGPRGGHEPRSMPHPSIKERVSLFRTPGRARCPLRAAPKASTKGKTFFSPENSRGGAAAALAPHRDQKNKLHGSYLSTCRGGPLIHNVAETRRTRLSTICQQTPHGKKVTYVYWSIYSIYFCLTQLPAILPKQKTQGERSRYLKNTPKLVGKGQL